MTLKKPAKLIAIAGACAVAVALPTSLALPGSFGPEADSDPEAAQSAAGVVAQPEPEPELPVGNAENALTSEEGEQVVDGETQASTDDGSSRVVDMIVQLKDGTDTAAALASINSAVAAAYPDASAEVKREYSNTFTGFALSAPIGSMDAIRGVSGVQSAFLDHETQVSDDGDDTPADAEGTGGADASADSGSAADAESNPMAAMRAAQHGDVLSAQVMMKADKISQTGAGKVVAIIDTGVEMNHPAFSGALHGTPAIDSSKGASLAQQVGKSGTYVSEKFPFAYDYADGDNDASPAGAHGTHVAGITAANGDQIMGIAPDAQIIVAKVARSRGGGIPDSALLAALDDMATLHPDAVNMSLGRTAGMDSDADTLFAGVYEKLQEKGITLDVAGGNEFQAGYGNKSGKNLPYASDPDSSTLGEPGSFAPVVTVASIENARNGANGNYKMSDFSSWGVSPDMRLKPEVTAPGGNIYSSVPGGGYQMMSGTSMATPQMTGASAVVLERVQNDPLFSSMSARQKADVVQNLIMGTATPVVDPLQDTGDPYSPRKQGSGLANVLAATTSSVYPTVAGAPESSRPKADLGDGTKGWHFDVTLHNLSGVEATYALNTQALSEIVDGGFFTGHSSDWRGKGVDIAYSGAAVSGTGEGATITVPASGEATVGVDVTPRAAFDSYVAQNAPNGTFLDGFVRLTSKTASQPDLTVPYMGFYGDWGKAPIFDALASDGGAHTLASGIYNGTTGQQLGYNPLVKADARTGNPKADRYVISRATASGAPTVLEPRTGTLRSVHTLKTTYASADGNVIADFTTHQAWKSGVNPSTGKMTWVEDGHEPTTLDLRSDAYKNLPDGDYTLTLSAHNDGPSQAEQSISYNFSIDTTAPTVDTLAFSEDGDAPHVTIAVTDNKPLAGIDLHDPADGLWFYRHIFTDSEATTAADGSRAYHVEIPFKDIAQAWTDQGGTGDVIANPYILAWDYGLNPSEIFPIDLPSGNPGTPSPCVSPEGGHWAKDGVGWWYVCAGGKQYLKGGWFTINGSDYLFGPSGYMATGFLKRANGDWVYADQDGAFVGGWVRDGGQWYYLDPSSKVMKTGWLADGGSWYYLTASGAMATGWVNDGGTWYYLNASGKMATGWVKDRGSWYYLSPSGAMLTGTQVINGRTYVFDDSGAWVR